MVETIQIKNGITLRCWQDLRFKQGCLTAQLVQPLTAQGLPGSALLGTVLLRGTKHTPDLRAITRRLDDLYGAALGPSFHRVGDYLATGIGCSFLDDRFALPGDRVLRPMLAFMKELLLDYPEEDGGFLPDFVESEKRNLISTIESERNDKRTYALSAMLGKLCSRDPFGLPRLGEPEQVAAITPRQLLAQYRTLLTQAPIELFYVGSAQPQALAEQVAEVFASLPPRSCALPPQSDLQGGEAGDFTEHMEITQGKLSMGFVTPITNRRPEFPAMQLLNTLFGAGMTSKLFMQLRERQSLCYHIGSSYYGTKGIVAVNAGVDFDKLEQTRQQVLHQLELCRRGEITPTELASAREALLSGLRATHDSPSAIEGYYSTAVLSGAPRSPEDYAAAVEAVTAEQVAAAAQSLQLRVTYFLKGERP